RRSAAIAGSFGVLAVSAGNLVGLAKQGGGLGAVAYGAWLASAGGLLLLLAAVAGPDDEAPTLAERTLPPVVEVAGVAASLAGLLDLGYIAFFGVGAYVAALTAGAGTTTSHIVLPYGVAILLGAVVAAIFGVIIGAPTLRLRGDYLAIVTLAFGEIFRIAVN